MKTELYKLTQDIPNPDYDGRCKHGLRAKKCFEKGTIINVRFRKLSDILPDIDPDKDREVRHVFLDNHRLYNDIAITVLGNCEPLDEFSITLNQIFAMYTASGNTVIRQLIEKGLVSIKDVHEIYKELE